MDLTHFADVVDSHTKDWGVVGITHEFRPPGESLKTPKPSASLRAESPAAIGELTVWVSGEADLEVIYLVDHAQRVVQYRLTEESLPAALNDFQELLLNRPADEFLVYLR